MYKHKIIHCKKSKKYFLDILKKIKSIKFIWNEERKKFKKEERNVFKKEIHSRKMNKCMPLTLKNIICKYSVNSKKAIQDRYLIKTKKKQIQESREKKIKKEER